MLEKVQRLLSKYTQEEISENSNLTKDLGLSSFDVVSIVTDFEDEFDIEILDRDIRKFVTVSDIIAYVQAKI